MTIAALVLRVSVSTLFCFVPQGALVDIHQGPDVLARFPLWYRFLNLMVQGSQASAGSPEDGTIRLETVGLGSGFTYTIVLGDPVGDEGFANAEMLKDLLLPAFGIVYLAKNAMEFGGS
jgi:hypothetical protein